MKKLLTFLTMALLFYGVGWAGTVTDYLDISQIGVTSSSYSNWTGVTSNSDAVYAGNCAKNATTNPASIQLRSSKSNSGIVTTTSGGKVKSISIAWNSYADNSGKELEVYGKNSAYTDATQLYSSSTKGTSLGSIVCETTGTSTSLTVSGDYKYIGIRSKSGAIYINSITIEWETDGGSTVETVATPTFDPAEGTYTSAQNVEISCATSGATIYYTTNGNDPTTSSDVYSSAIAVSSTTTIKALAVMSGMNNSSVASATYTINTITSVANIAEYNQLADNAEFSFTGDVVVTYFNSTDNRYVWVKDATGSALLYNSGLNPSQGDIIKGGWSGKRTKYNGLYEITNVSGATIQGSETVTPAELTISQITTANQATFGYLRGVTITAKNNRNFTISDGTSTVAGYNTYNSDTNISVPEANNGKTYDILGIVNVYNNVQFTPVAFNEVVSTLPEYYLYGTFNNWAIGDEDYKFTLNENNSYSLNDIELPANVRFKIAKVEGNANTEYGASNNGSDYGINSGWHTNLPMDGADAYTIASSGKAKITLNTSNMTFSVEKTQLFLKGSYDQYSTATEMTVTANGWTVTKELAVDDNIGFTDGWGDWHGGNGAWILEEYLGDELAMSTEGNFVIRVSGNYTLTVNSDISKLVATVETTSTGDEYTLVTSADDLVAGDEYIIVANHSTLGYYALSTDDAVTSSGGTDNKYRNADNNLTVSGNVATAGTSITPFTLEGHIGAWKFHNSAGYLYLGSYNNYLYCGTPYNSSEAATTITIENDNTATIVFNDYPTKSDNDNTVRLIQFYPNNQSGTYYPRFSTYASTQPKIVYLYHKASTNKSATPTITPATQNVKGGLLEGVTITATNGATIYYTLDGTEPTTASAVYDGEPFNVTGTGGQTKYVKAIAVETGKEPSNVATAAYTFQAPSNPVITPNGGTYAGTQHVTISSSDGGTIYYLVDPETAPTNAAGVIAGRQVYTAGSTSIVLEAGIHKVFAAVDLNGITSWAQESYTINADPMTLSFSPAAGTYVNAQSVTITANNAVGEYTIYYTTDGTEATANSAVYTSPISVNEDMTINAYAVDSRENGLEGKEATASATYHIGVQPVEYSPIPGDYYVGDDGDITVEMFSVTPNAKVYYTMTDDDSEPADPTTSSTLYTGDIPLETGKTYKFKAIAAAGQQITAIAPATYTIGTKPNSGWVDVDAMNTDNNYSTDDVLLNPVQVVYMSTHRNNGTKPEFCFIRDNSGYGMVYFGGTNVHDYDNWAKFQMGDWLPGNSISGTLNVWSDSFINELGGSSGTLETWPSTTLGNSDILPEETTNLAITQGWTYDGAFSGNDYAQYIDPDKNLFGHYVHMRKNTIENVTGAGGGTGKHAGIITDQSGVPLNYYDGLYLFSGYNGTPDYNQAFFDDIQNNGGTFDIYAIVYFYGTNASKEEYSYAPYEIFPIDFMWIYKPLFNILSGTYMEPQTVTLTCATEGAQIWYKTSEMEDFALYTGPITVDATTTIEAYSTIPTKYNDVMESAINSITVTIGTVEAPVITEPSVVKTVGENVSTTITCATDGATIYYTTDGSDPKTSETRIEYTAGTTLTFTETTTVRAIAYQEVEGTGYYSVEAEARTYTFVKSNGIEYTLVTDANQLNENDVYVIVNKANNMALGRTQNANNRDAAGVMFKNTDKTIVYENDEVAQFTLKKVGNNWYLQTANSSVNGSLYVGDGNTLLTEATPDGNAEATISIDGNSEAHISFMYNYETTRYLRYYNSGKVFSTYTSENSNLPVALYRRAVTSLANIEKEGTQGQQYTVADRLLVVAANDEHHVIWAKDEGNVSIARTEIKDGQIDYMRYVAENDISNAQDAGVLFQDGDWDQSNWVMIKLLAGDAHYDDDASYYVNAYILPASLTGKYTDDLNYTIEAMTSLEDIVDATGGEFTPNVYCAANFLDANLNLTDESTGAAGTGGRHYFFVNPKVQEVATITYAVWDGENSKFVMPARNDAGTINGAGLTGAFNVGWTYNGSTPTLKTGVAYQFTAVLNKVAQQSNAPRRAESTVEPGAFSADAGKVVYPLDLTADESHIVTEVRDLNANGVREVASVKYVSITGVVSDKPFEGMNIIVTRYTDGTTSTAKVMR